MGPMCRFRSTLSVNACSILASRFFSFVRGLMIRTVVRSYLSRRATSTLFALFFIAVVSCNAQFNGAVQGTVEDNSGNAVPSSTVTLTNVDNKVTQTVTSNDSGVYRFSSLAPGNYQIAGSAPGLSSSKTAFTLSTAETRDVTITLGVSSVATQVEVTEQAPLLDPSDSRNELTLNTAALEQLPLAARNPLALITLAPGVTGLGAGASTNFNPENWIDASANGRGANANQYIV